MSVILMARRPTAIVPTQRMLFVLKNDKNIGEEVMEDPAADGTDMRVRNKAMSRRLTLSLVATAGFSAAAQAQTVPKPPTAMVAPQSDPAPADGGLADIIVTAQKRSENLQKVPLSVIAVTADEALARGITGTQALSTAVPGLVLNNPSNVGNPYLRGIGSNLVDPSAEQGVALYVDGVYIAVPMANLFSFNNIEQVEVLRGPQGTLFGRNATGGVIQITTRRPSAETHGDFSVGLGSYETVTASGYLSGKLADHVYADIAGLYENQGKGFGRNLFLNREAYQMALGNYSLRSKLVFEAGPRTTFTLAGDYAHGVSTNAYQKPPGTIAIDGSTYPGPFNNRNDLFSRNQVNTGGASLRFEQGLGDLSFVDIASYRKTDVHFTHDVDLTPRRVGDIEYFTTAHNWSNEVQLLGPGNGRLKWMLGGYYYNAVGAHPLVYVNGNRSHSTEQDSISYAAFGQATLQLLPKTDVTVGLRYTTEEQTFIQTYAVSRRLQQSFDKLTYRFALKQQFTENVSAYASYNRGFKSGGYNLRLPGNSFGPETLDAYEIGVKSELFNKRLRFNLNGFYYDDKNVQVLSVFLGGTVTSNAAAAVVKGVEAELEAAITRRFHLSGGLSIQHGEYTKFPTGFTVTSAGVQTQPVDLKGNQTIVTPPFTGTVTASYDVDLGTSGRLQPSVTFAYNDGYFWQPDNRLVQPAYSLINATLRWTSTNERYSAQIWAKNLSNSTYYIARLGTATVGDVQEQAPPRTVGVTFGVHM